MPLCRFSACERLLRAEQLAKISKARIAAKEAAGRLDNLFHEALAISVEQIARRFVPAALCLHPGACDLWRPRRQKTTPRLFSGAEEDPLQ